MRSPDIIERRRRRQAASSWSCSSIAVLIVVILSACIFISVSLHLHFHVSEHVEEDLGKEAKSFPFVFSKTIRNFEEEAIKEALDLESKAVDALKSLHVPNGLKEEFKALYLQPHASAHHVEKSIDKIISELEQNEEGEEEGEGEEEPFDVNDPLVKKDLEEELKEEELLDLSHATKDDQSESGNDPSPTSLTSAALQSFERVSGQVHYPSCPNVDRVIFWKDPYKRDLEAVSPFASVGPKMKYVTFEPDVGGWNNIRMQMETVLVFAASTGRTLVLPPDQPLYLLNKGKGHDNQHSFADFFPFEEIRKRLPVISMKEFFEREAVTGRLKKNPMSIPGVTIPKSTLDKEFIDVANGTVLYPPGNKTELVGEDEKHFSANRILMWDYLRLVGTSPKWEGDKDFIAIPPGPGIDVTKLKDNAEYMRRRAIGAGDPGCGHARDTCVRKPIVYDDFWQKQKLIHFISKPEEGWRLLQHFYTFIHFDDPKADLMWKRFVRDYVHYIDVIFCKAAIIINHLLWEGNGSYTSFHIRRGDFQYKIVKIPAGEIIDNVGSHLPRNGLAFLATDEKNKSFFSDFKRQFKKIRYLDDYMKIADLKGINPNYLGMIDQIVCTRSSHFVGTWFSTFSGYITRMRGYLGYKDETVWYGSKAHKSRYQHHELPQFPYYMREWNISWDNIDEQL